MGEAQELVTRFFLVLVYNVNSSNLCFVPSWMIKPPAVWCIWVNVGFGYLFKKISNNSKSHKHNTYISSIVGSVCVVYTKFMPRINIICEIRLLFVPATALKTVWLLQKIGSSASNSGQLLLNLDFVIDQSIPTVVIIVVNKIKMVTYFSDLCTWCLLFFLTKAHFVCIRITHGTNNVNNIIHLARLLSNFSNIDVLNMWTEFAKKLLLVTYIIKNDVHIKYRNNNSVTQDIFNFFSK